MTDDVIDEGVRLMRNNSRRLASDAARLLDGGGTPATVYAIWHFAVADLGKSDLVAEYKTSVQGPRRHVSEAAIRGDHERKLRMGLRRLPKAGAPLGIMAEIRASEATRSVELPDPAGMGARVVVAGHTTGRFEDTAPRQGRKASHKTRLRFLYVDYDGAKWLTPEQEVVGKVHGTITMSASFLGELIAELRETLDALGHAG